MDSLIWTYTRQCENAIRQGGDKRGRAVGRRGRRTVVWERWRTFVRAAFQGTISSLHTWSDNWIRG